ncbi:MAG: hypothetical protein VKK42_16815 [Lyngbya sp.]|nr:hypothetical protein [Lyngbya sp.]
MDNLSPQTLSIRAAQPDNVIHLLLIQRQQRSRSLCVRDYTPKNYWAF